MDPILPSGPPPEPNPFEPPRPPRSAPGRPVSCLGHILGGTAAVLSGLVAFVGTCFPIAYAPTALGAHPAVSQIVPLLACVVGVVAALRVASGVSRQIAQAQQRPLPPSSEHDAG